MSVREILQLGHPILRQKAVRVGADGISSTAIQNCIVDMIETLRDCTAGAALAAPQIGESWRIIVLETKRVSTLHPGRKPIPFTVLINPEILAHSEECEEGWESCLSFPDLRGRVSRYRKIEIAGLDRMGDAQHFEAEDFLARALQHEIDHLDGILFLDRMVDLQTLTCRNEFEKFWRDRSFVA